MFGITTGQGVQIGIDAFRGDRIADEVVQCQVVYLDGLRTCPRCSGLDEVIQDFPCELCEHFVADWLVELRGFEPLTSCLQSRRSPN